MHMPRWHAVLNPAIRMSWIRKQWDNDYIDIAEKKIREIVSVFVYHLCFEMSSLTPTD